MSQLFGFGRVLDVAVVVDRLAIAVLQRLPDRGQHLVLHEQRRAARAHRIERRRVGEQVAVPRPVGRVQIHHQRRIPGRVDALERGARLGRLRLEVVAVEVEVERVGAVADHQRPVLLAAVLRHGPEVVVAVRVVVGHRQDHQLLQQVAPRPRQLAQQDQQRLFPLHFAGVDVPLEIDDELARRRGLGGRRDGRVGRDDQVERLPLPGAAHGRDGDRRARELEAVEEERRPARSRRSSRSWCARRPSWARSAQGGPAPRRRSRAQAGARRCVNRWWRASANLRRINRFRRTRLDHGAGSPSERLIETLSRVGAQTSDPRPTWRYRTTSQGTRRSDRFLEDSR